jgi:hypothetical protein
VNLADRVLAGFLTVSSSVRNIRLVGFSADRLGRLDRVEREARKERIERGERRAVMDRRGVSN